MTVCSITVEEHYAKRLLWQKDRKEQNMWQCGLKNWHLLCLFLKVISLHFLGTLKTSSLAWFENEKCKFHSKREWSGQFNKTDLHSNVTAKTCSSLKLKPARQHGKIKSSFLSSFIVVCTSKLISFNSFHREIEMNNCLYSWGEKRLKPFFPCVYFRICIKPDTSVHSLISSHAK